MLDEGYEFVETNVFNFKNVFFNCERNLMIITFEDSIMIYRVEKDNKDERRYWKTINNINVIDLLFEQNLIFIITLEEVKMLVIDFEDDYLLLDLAKFSYEEEVYS